MIASVKKLSAKILLVAMVSYLRILGCCLFTVKGKWNTQSVLIEQGRETRELAVLSSLQ